MRTYDIFYSKGNATYNHIFVRIFRFLRWKKYKKRNIYVSTTFLLPVEEKRWNPSDFCKHETVTLECIAGNFFAKQLPTHTVGKNPSLLQESQLNCLRKHNKPVVIPRAYCTIHNCRKKIIASLFPIGHHRFTVISTHTHTYTRAHNYTYS